MESALVAEVPSGVTTVTSTVLTARAGAVAVIVVEFTTENVADVVPNLTDVAPVKFVPVMVIVSPPSDVSVSGERPVTVGGGGATNVYLALRPVAEVPSPVVTVTSTSPAACAGATAVIDVDELTRYDVAFVAPNLTDVAPVNLVPVMVTEVVPAVGPLVGDTSVTVGVLSM